jgi:hypothetical protein
MTTETAFPVQSVYIEDQETNSRGMTLRDYFAAKAMQGYAHYSAANSKFVFSNQELAKDAYLIADAMMKAREL